MPLDPKDLIRAGLRRDQFGRRLLRFRSYGVALEPDERLSSGTVKDANNIECVALVDASGNSIDPLSSPGTPAAVVIGIGAPWTNDTGRPVFLKVPVSISYLTNGTLAYFSLLVETGSGTGAYDTVDRVGGQSPAAAGLIQLLSLSALVPPGCRADLSSSVTGSANMNIGSPVSVSL